jgi:peptidoglycan/LPS O-acetylase OafA/YrhL
MQAAYLEASKPATKSTSRGARLDFLDALRGIAALLVVVQHAGERFTASIPWFAQNWFSFGRFGVTVFFLVSGFVIPYAFEKDQSVKSFWIKRIFRLYPLYWLSLGITIAAQIEPADFPHTHLLRNLIVNATMLQGFVGIPNASAPYWTLFIEMAFYIAFTAWFLLRLQRKSLLWAWVGVAGFCGVSVLAPLLIGAHAPVTKLFSFVAILLGSVLYRSYSGQVSRRALVALLSAVLLFAAAASYLNFFKFPSSEHISATSVFLSWAIAFLAFGILFAGRSLNFPKPVLWLGKISYSLYLLHAVVLDVMPDFGNKALDFALVLGVSAIVSALSFRYLERPFVSLGHRVARRMV